MARPSLVMSASVTSTHLGWSVYPALAMRTTCEPSGERSQPTPLRPWRFCMTCPCPTCRQLCHLQLRLVEAAGGGIVGLNVAVGLGSDHFPRAGYIPSLPLVLVDRTEFSQRMPSETLPYGRRSLESG